MADRYTLPAETKIGGEWVEVPGSRRGGSVSLTQADALVDEEAIVLNVMRSLLIPVKPPPDDDEPRYDAQALIDAFVAAKLAGVRGLGEHRYWFRSNEQAAEQAWRVADRFFSPLLARSDPFAEPVQLPWHGRTHVLGLPIAVDVHGSHVQIVLSSRDYLLARSVARDFCRAVWAAANQADKAGHE